MNILKLTILIILSFNCFSAPEDIRSRKNGIRVTNKTENGLNYTKFEYCSKVNNDILFNCIAIGNKNWYSHEELSSQKVQEKLELFGTVGADIAMVAALGLLLKVTSPGTGLITLLSKFGFKITATQAAKFLGLSFLTGLHVEQLLMTQNRSINPAAQYRDVKVLKPSVINDTDIETSMENVLELVESLEIVLDKLN